MPTQPTPVIYWFRQDLRLHDLPGLLAAAETGPVIPCYVFDPDGAGAWAPGGASRWWLHHSLEALEQSLAELGSRLLVFRGDTAAILDELARSSGADAVFCSRAYEPWAAQLERRVHDTLQNSGVSCKRYHGNLLFEPEQIANQSGLPFKVFTPFWRACRRQPTPGTPRQAPGRGTFADPGALDIAAAEADNLAGLDLLPTRPNWAEGWEQHWQPGEAGAAERLDRFIDKALSRYSDGRDHPSIEATSRLSPHLHLGEISPRQVWHRTMDRAGSTSAGAGDNVDKFLCELGWREFSYHLLHHFPTIPEAPFKAQFSEFPWLGQQAQLEAWQRGQTGYPIVDAGMRELWQTGFMHNRVRMVVASFLTKHLLISWRAGEDWFWDTLVDADLASNSCSWQWVAGSGADAAPYFRIFNPTAQGQKFDKDGDYVRRWVPELAALPNKHIHEPAAAPAQVLDAAGISLGDTYPHPIVDHREARQSALDAYAAIKLAS